MPRSAKVTDNFVLQNRQFRSGIPPILASASIKYQLAEEYRTRVQPSQIPEIIWNFMDTPT